MMPRLVTEHVANASGMLVALVVGSLYLVSAQYTIFLNDPVFAGAGFWPPAGVSLAALLMLPKNKWGWVLGAVAVAEIGGSVANGYPLLASIPWAAGNVIEPLLAASLLLRFGNGGRLAPIGNLLWFLGCGVLVSPLVGALIGSIGTTLAFDKPYLTIATKWWIGDGLGVLVVAPLLLAWRDWRTLSMRQWEAPVLSFLVVCVTGLAFYPWQSEWGLHLPYLTTPLLIWAGVRFGVLGAATAGFVVAQAANLASGLGLWPLGMSIAPEGHTLTLVQVFIAILLTTGLFVAALAAELAERSALERVLNDQAAQLRQSEARLRDFAEVASDWLWETDDQFRFTRYDGKRRTSSEDLRTQMIGRTRWEVSGSAMTDEWQEHRRCLEDRQPFYDFTYAIVDEGGRTRHLSSSGRPVFDEGGGFLGYRGVSTDLTERLKSEERLRQAYKMEAVGQLTGGIAHDFNNLLTVIIGNAEILSDDKVDPSETKNLSRVILETAERGAELTQHMLAFGRRQSLRPVRLRLSHVVQGMMPLLHRTLGEHIELRTEFGQSSLTALTDRTLLENAILNLVVNARDAMPKGGILTIAAGQRQAQHGEGQLPIGQDVVFVSVSDTGNGISPELLPRVFEPFFTTKGVGKGSGLGLSMVYGFANQAAGHVSIKSELGRGTSVTITLPAVVSQQQPDAASKPIPIPLPRGKERVLLVEDEPQVLQYVAAQLLALGYDMTAVSDGPDALAVLKNDKDFDLLLTDLVLPNGMSGVDLGRVARVITPSLKVIFTSGYSEEMVQQHGLAQDDVPLLRKPYRRKELADMLRRVLETSPAASRSSADL